MKEQFLVLLLIIAAIFPGRVISQTAAPVELKNSITSGFVLRDNLIGFARTFLGAPYLYASSTPEKGFDCSGFVNFVFKNFDIAVPHSSKAFKNMGKLLKPEEFKIGDVLVFYGYRNTAEIGHVGIICEASGMNSKFIHSSSGKVKGVIISELNSEMYSHRFYQCVDVIGVK